jgi:hypothetical protein
LKIGIGSSGRRSPYRHVKTEEESPGVKSSATGKEPGMRLRSFAIVVALFAGSFALAKGKKDILPPYVLNAKTVSVVIDPDSGIDPEDPRANEIARKDVEAAMVKWGRLEPMIVGQPADLIIVVRRGQKRMVSETIPDARQNDRTGVINPTDSGVQIGGQRGQPTNSGPIGGTQSNTQAPVPSIQSEIGEQEDTFAVYDGSVQHPLNMPAAWRYVGRDGLRPHSVPAVDEFRKAVAAAEKAAQKKP